MAVTLADVKDEEFADIYRGVGAREISELYGISERAVFAHKKRVEVRLGRSISRDRGQLASVAHLQDVGFEAKEMIEFGVKGGCVIVASDCHYWPGLISTAHKGLLKFAAEMKPKAIVVNGDVLDGATISRFPPPGWEYQPELIDELETCFDRLEEIKAAAPKARRVWTYGNHDQRFELKLATLTREYKGVKGFHLHDHFEDWERCWGAWINSDLGSQSVIVKHRYKGGAHATYNNILHGGCHMVTGHLHASKVTPKTNYMGTLYGVDSGTLAEPRGRQFTNYTEAGPTDWRSGFAVLTFDKKGRLFEPELVKVVKKGVVEFRAKYIKV